MSDSQIPPPPDPRWAPLEPPPPRPSDAVIVPEGQLADVLTDGLLEALKEEGPNVAFDPRWKAARDTFMASVDEKWGALIFKELCAAVANQKDGARESARDLFQKAMLVACRRFDEHFEKTGEAWKPDNPGAYFRKVARNVAKDHFKVKARKPAIARGVEVDDAAGLGLDPEEEVCHAELQAIFERERGKLTAEESAVFEGRALGMTFQAIAAVLQRNINTVYAQYRRAVEKLKAALESA